MEDGYVIPAGARTGPIRDLWRRRGLLWSLTLREVQVRYRQAALGVLWAVLQPLALMAVTTLVFHRALHVDVGDVPYPIFVLTGLFPWTFFHTAVMSAVPSLVTNASLVRKIYFPREALPLAAVGAAGLDLVVGLGLWVLLLASGPGLHLSGAWVAVLGLLLLLVVAAVGPSLLGAAVNVSYRDVKHALPLLLQVVFFATPIVYRLDAVPEPWRGVVLLNPLTTVVEGLRAVAFEGRVPSLGSVLPGVLSAVVLLIVAYAVFLRAGRRFADVV